jgi:hypothetical protein
MATIEYATGTSYSSRTIIAFLVIRFIRLTFAMSATIVAASTPIPPSRDSAQWHPF